MCLFMNITLKSFYKSNGISVQEKTVKYRNYAKGTCKLETYLVLIPCTSELDRNWSLFLIINKSEEKTAAVKY